MKEVTLTVIIDRPADEVFRFTLDPANTPRWIDGIVREIADPLPARLGSIYKNRGEDGPWTELAITSFEPGRMFVMSRRDGAYHVKYTLTENDGRTALEYVEWTDEGDLEVPFTQDALDKLKVVMEADHES